MTQLQEIKLMNESMILYLKKIGKNSYRNEIISKILKDDTCFFKISKEEAYIILEDIGIAKDKVDLIYSNLISHDIYYDLQKKGKISENDEDIIIKYRNYDSNDLFKNRKEANETIEYKNNSIVEYKETILKRIINKIKTFLEKYKNDYNK